MVMGMTSPTRRVSRIVRQWSRGGLVSLGTGTADMRSSLHEYAVHVPDHVPRAQVQLVGVARRGGNREVVDPVLPFAVLPASIHPCHANLLLPQPEAARRDGAALKIGPHLDRFINALDQHRLKRPLILMRRRLAS